jgi:CheY-like chemotaxis protein
VDDVVLNLEVAQEMLASHGIVCTCVESGQAAIDAIRKGKPKFDIVFMDQLMPGMNGIEATRIIRENIAGDYPKALPVIALTANAMMGTEQTLLQSGFNGYISKPIESKQLDSVLAKWLKAVPGKDSQKSALPSPPPLPPPKTLRGLDYAKLQTTFGAEKAAKFIQTYARSAQKVIDDIGNAQGDSLVILAHSLKGASRTVFADELGTLAEEVEHAARNQKWDEVRAKTPTLMQKAKDLLSDIAKF